MGSKLIIFTILSLLFGVHPVFAIDPPMLQSPSNTGTTTSSKLEWQAPIYPLFTTKPYNIQVDENSNFTTPDKDYDTNNTYYTPVLDPGTWYWRVKAKDSTGASSAWSSVWSFTLITPSPTPIQTNTPTPTTSDPSPNPSPLFTISNVSSQINSNQSFTVSANISSSGNFYCKGAFKKSESSNYFGLTKVNGSWIKNSSNFANQSPCSNTLNLEIKPDTDDSGYTGTGDYIFKVAKYDTDGGNLSWSNEVTIKIINITAPASPSPQTTTKASPLPSPTPFSSPKNSNSPTPKPSSTISNNYQVASVAAIATTSPIFEGVKVKNENNINPLIWIGLIFIFAGSGIIGYIYLKKNRR